MKPSTILNAIRHPLHALYSDAAINSLVPSGRKHAWITAAPKSGSTWLTEILKVLLGWHPLYLVPAYERREQEGELRRLLLAPRRQNIFSPSLHTRCNEETLKIIQKGNIHTIIQFRNIFDTVISFRDHLDADFAESVYWSMAYMDKDIWASLDDESRLDFVIDMVVPWYFNFYCGWVRSDFIRQKERALVLTYEALKGDPVGEVARICRFLDESKSEGEIRAAIEGSREKNTRKNKGIVGRGEAQLGDAQRARIIHYARYYPAVDFAHLGMPDEMLPWRAGS